MPIYEYVCKACGRESEALIPASRRDEARDCSECGGSCQRKVSVFGFTSSSRGTVAGKKGSGCGSCASTSCGSCSCH